MAPISHERAPGSPLVARSRKQGALDRRRLGPVEVGEAREDHGVDPPAGRPQDRAHEGRVDGRAGVRRRVVGQARRARLVDSAAPGAADPDPQRRPQEGVVAGEPGHPVEDRPARRRRREGRRARVDLLERQGVELLEAPGELVGQRLEDGPLRHRRAPRPLAPQLGERPVFLGEAEQIRGRRRHREERSEKAARAPPARPSRRTIAPESEERDACTLQSPARPPASEKRWRAWAARGAAVTLVARRKERLDQIAAEIGGKTFVQAADLSLADHATDWIAPAEAALGPIDVLVNNAGVQTIEETSLASVEKGEEMLRLNVFTPMRLTRAVLPKMLARRSGTIVDIASMAALALMPGMFYYNAAKGGLGNASEGLHGELLGTGVHVLTVYPGPVDTDMARRGFERYEKSLSARLSRWGRQRGWRG